MTATKIEKNNKEPVGLNQNMYSDYFLYLLDAWESSENAFHRPARIISFICTCMFLCLCALCSAEHGAGMTVATATIWQNDDETWTKYQKLEQNKIELNEKQNPM